MKKLKIFGMAMLAMFACVNFTACSDDDDEGGGGGGAAAGGRKLKTMYRESGSGYKSYEFADAKWSGNKLASFTRGDEAPEEELRMTITYADGGKAFITRTEYDCEVTLNAKGYAETANFGGSEYVFSYNQAGQMTRWESDGGEYCTISYNSDGDIVNASSSYEGSKSFTYTNTEVTSPIENKGGIMLMGDWGIMWDWEYYYWFGIYGAATKHLPVRVGDATFSWTLDSQGYPTQCVVNDPEGDGVDTYHFEWE